MDILEIEKHTQLLGREILEETPLITEWESIGARVHLVGSMKTGLIIKKDIDMHIYTDKLSIAESFTVMKQLAAKMQLKEIQYINGINTEEECIEWHALYEDKHSYLWKFDMIHIRSGSKYDGVVEKVTEAIANRLTPETRKAILQIKYDTPEGINIPGIEIYHAVFTGNVRSYKEFEQWRQANPLTDSLNWMP